MRYKGRKGTAWNLVKQWVRKNYTDCYTCPAKDLSSYNAQAGHYWPVGLVGANNKKSWDSRFIRLQCGRCNGAGQGMQVQFRRNLVREHGEEVVAQFDKEVLAKKVDPVDIEEVINSYKNMLGLT